MRKNLKAYKTANNNSRLAVADPHSVISMLFDGIIESLAIAKGAIERSDLALKSEKISKATAIFRSLQSCLDNDNEPNISDNFYNLYEYCIERLAESSVSLDTTIIDEVISLIKPVADAWKDMPEAAKQEGIDKLNSKNNGMSQASLA